MRDKEQRILRIGTYGNRVAGLIGILSILLPILFWKRIPEEIPMHFGGDGVVDRIGQKMEFVLLFVMVGILVGVMNLALYLVRVELRSSHTTEIEQNSLVLIYPMLVLMNFFLMCGFAYIIFCSVTSRNLGKYFLFLFCFVTVAPLLYFLYRNGKERRLLSTENNRYRLIEKTVEGKRYRAHVDIWIGVLLGGAVLYPIWVTIETLMETGRVTGMIFINLLITATVLPIFFIQYTFYPDHLLVSCGLYGKERIPYDSIVLLKETHNPMSSAAPSLDRIQIEYVRKGRKDMILISPVHKKVFLEELQERRLTAQQKEREMIEDI